MIRLLALLILVAAEALTAVPQANLPTDQYSSEFSQLTERWRSLASGIRRYEVDFGRFPASQSESQTSTPLMRMTNVVNQLIMLQYLPERARRDGVDPFSQEGSSLNYYSPKEKHGWIITSVGPDRKLSFEPALTYVPWDPTSWDKILGRSYDPTNGLLSSGDLWMSEEMLQYQHKAEPKVPFVDFINGK